MADDSSALADRLATDPSCDVAIAATRARQERMRRLADALSRFIQSAEMRQIACLLAMIFSTSPALGQTIEQHNDPAFWAQQRQHALSRQNPTSQNMRERFVTCERWEMEIEKEFQRVWGFMYDRHILAGDPSKAYITEGSSKTDERELQTLAHVGMREIRQAEYNGADPERCEAIAQDAVHRMRTVISKYPDFHEYDPTQRIQYR